MLHEEIAKYRELSGDTNPNTPISRIGGYLDGYERALEQELCEDAVSRQAVLDIFADNADATRPYSTAWEKIRDLPSVNSQPKIGHWIQTQEKDDAEPCILWECSECHKEFRSVVHKVSNYCPNCGSHNGDVRKWRDKE